MTPKTTPLLERLMTDMDFLVCDRDGECDSCDNAAECDNLAESIIAETEAIRLAAETPEEA
jgi:hypothetical protein